MANDLVPSEGRAVAPRAPVSIFQMEPRAMVERATEIATVLKDVITQQKLSVKIGPNEHVKAEGWATLGTLLGVMPKERNVIEHANGDFEAYVDLVSQSTGTVIGGGSALCSVEEARWAKAERYARRSMAITRATGKAYRLCFAWVVSLAGYESTPAEEMPEEPRQEKQAREAPRQVSAAKSRGQRYDPQNPAHAKQMILDLEAKGVKDTEAQERASEAMKGKYADELDVVLADLQLPF